MAQHFNRSRSFATAPDTFVSTAREGEVIAGLQNKLKAIVADSFPSTDKLVAALEAVGLPVIYGEPELPIKLTMMLTGAQAGYIAPSLPKYTEFVRAVKKLYPDKAHLDYSRGLMVMTKEIFQYPNIAYHAYHWLSAKANLDGYQDKARKLYDTFANKYQGQLHPQFLAKLDAEETALLRSAIRRDKEAWLFIRKILNEVFSPKCNAKLIQDGSAEA